MPFLLITVLKSYDAAEWEKANIENYENPVTVQCEGGDACDVKKKRGK